MGIKEVAISLYLMQIERGGILPEKFHSMNPMEQHMLERKGELYFLKNEYRKLFKVAMTGGVFDIIHVGHVLTLYEAKKEAEADLLVVVVATDEHIFKKNRTPIHSQEHRKVLVQALKPVDVALLGSDDIVATMEMVGPDVIVYGYDQEPFLKPEGVKVVKLKTKINAENVKTSKILKKFGF